MSRPEKWDDKFLVMARKACELGATDLDLAEMLGVCIRTIRYWRSTKPDFAQVLMAGKGLADQQVERSLFQRAMGYSCNEDDIRVIDNQIVITPTIKHYPPDTTAMIFWLKNRKSAEWRDKQEIEHSGLPRVIVRDLSGRKNEPAADD